MVVTIKYFDKIFKQYMKNLHHFFNQTATKLKAAALISAFAWASLTHAQDALFGQFYAAPMQLNPAMTGLFNGQWRANANYRQQWTGVFSDRPLRTIHAAFDYRFRVMDDDFLAVGINALEDQIGGEARLRRTYSNLSFAYHKQLSGNRYRAADQYLIIGGQIGMGQHGINTPDLWFDRQFDVPNSQVNRNLPSGEVNPQSKIFPDANLGLMWYTVAGENRSFYGGLSVHHLLQPNITFFNDSKERLYRRFSLNVGGEVAFSDELSMLPALWTTLQGPSMTTIFGSNLRYSNHDWYEIAVRIGAWYRLANRYVWKASTNTTTPTTGGSTIFSDAVTISTILEMERWNLGFSYDIHISSLARPTNTRGAFEISLIYIHPEIRRVKTICPKF